MNNNLPLVSVIIPTYKRSKFIDRAIESVISQTYKNIEIIVIDDNNPSSEYRKNTRNKLQKYIIANSIRYIQNEKNIGGALTRNRGIHEANGKYIAFLDDDDIFYPEKIERQLKLIIEHKDSNVGLVYCHCNGVDIYGNILWRNINSYTGLPLYESMIRCIANTSLWLCDKDMLVEIGGFEDTPSKQDLLLMVKIIANDYKIICVEEVLVEYLEHNEGKISTNNANLRIAKGYENLREFCRKYYNKLEKYQIKDVEYRFARTLCLQYIGLVDRKSKYREFRRMIETKPFSLTNARMLLRIVGI